MVRRNKTLLSLVATLVLLGWGAPGEALASCGDYVIPQNQEQLGPPDSGRRRRDEQHSAIGARVILKAGGKTYKRELTSARGYLSRSEFTLTFGLGKTDKIDEVEIIWPGKSAGRQVVRDLAVNREHLIRQGVK